MNRQDAKDAKKDKVEEPSARLDLISHSVIGAPIKVQLKSGIKRVVLSHQSPGALGVLAVDP